MADGDILIFSSIRDDLYQTLDLCLVVEGHTEQLNGGIVDVIIGCNHSQVERCYIHLIFNADTLKHRKHIFKC